MEAASPRPLIVCLCGSTRFKPEYEEWNKRLSLLGEIVVGPGLYGHSGDTITTSQKLALDGLHRKKIDLADYVLVINHGEATGGRPYIGDSTASEIYYARFWGKPVYYTHPEYPHTPDFEEMMQE